MKKVIISIVLSLIVIAVALVFAFNYIVEVNSHEITFNYTETDEVLDNPERGYYFQIYSGDDWAFENLVNGGYRIALITSEIVDFTDIELTDEKLNQIRTTFENARKNDVAVVFRAGYGFWGRVDEPDDIELMGRHIEQLSEVINEYSDIIISVQAGMLGAFGEWHSGQYLTLSEEESKKYRLYVLGKWEEFLSEDIEVAARRPRFIREAHEAGILIDRLGFHNDGFLSTHDDLGTYDDPLFTREQELAWLDENTAHLVMGGEMPFLAEYVEPEVADSEFKQLHTTYLNSMYNSDIIKYWDTLTYNGQNAGLYFNNHLGYRLNISQVDISYNNYKILSDMYGTTMSLNLQNTGYAPLDEEYSVYFVTDINGEITYEKLTDEEIYKMCNGEEVTLNPTLTLPEEMTPNDKINFGIKIAKSLDEQNEKNIVKLANEFDFENTITWIFSASVSDNGILSEISFSD